MRSCPHCGVDNSVKREICYQCRRPLAAAPEAAPPAAGPADGTAPGVPAAESAPPAAGSRWDALELPQGQRPRPRPPESGAGVEYQPQPAVSSRPVAEPAAGAETRRRRWAPARRGLRHVRQMAAFFRQLHLVTRAGLPIGQACRDVSRRSPRRLRAIAEEMAETAESGKRISAVIERHGRTFEPWHAGVIRAAEVAGLLPQAFEQIAEAYETEWQTRAAFVLPLFLYGFFGLPGILVAIPSIMTLAQPIPEVGWTPELYVAALLENARAVSLPIVLGIVGFIVLWRILSYARWFQGLQQRIAIHLPFVGKVARRAALGRYTGALGLMLQGGVPVGEAAEEAALAAGHAAFTPRLLKAAAALRSGTPLSQTVVEARVFDFETIGMIATGDESGAAPEMLQRVAHYYRQENEAALHMVRRGAWYVIGAFWAIIAGVVVVIGLRVYYLDFIFRVPEWIGE